MKKMSSHIISITHVPPAFTVMYLCVPYPTTSVTTATMDQPYSISFRHVVVIPVKFISHIIIENKCDVYRTSAASIDLRLLPTPSCCYHINFSQAHFRFSESNPWVRLRRHSKMPNSATPLFQKVLAELYYCSILFIKKISEESLEIQVCFILGVVAVPVAFTIVFGVTRCKRRKEATERWRRIILSADSTGCPICS